ncbi:unnamed protein product, partial [Brachionus calyciflorus]
MTPYEVMFGKKSNNFEDWRTLNKNRMEEDLLYRAIEIRKTVEEVRPKAIENIEAAQEKQKDLTNKRNKRI